MEKLTDHEMIAAKKLGEAIMEFLIALEVGRRSRTPAPPVPQVEVKLPQIPRPPAPKPEPAKESKVPAVDPGQLIGVEKVGELLGCSPRTVYRLADIGQLPRPRRVGTLVRWPIMEIRKWIDEGCPKQYRGR